MRTFIALLLGLAIGAAAVWFYTANRSDPRLHAAEKKVSGATQSARDALEGKLRVLDLSSEDIKDELARGGQVVRRKAREAGKVIADATADARTTAAIKARLVASRDLSALDISVNTTAGVVTLAGPVSTLDQVSKAMLLAMETEGVREVISTLQVRPKR